MKTISAACLAALIASCSSGQKGADAPSNETSSPTPPGLNAGGEQAAPSGSAGTMEPDELALMHIAQVINIIRDLMHDCEAAQRKSMAYIERNREAIVGGVAYGQNKEKALQGQDKDAYEAKMEALLNELAPDFDKVLDSFGSVCPDQKEAIGSTMGL